MKRKLLNTLLLITFILTMMVPLTGIILHKLASMLFLILCVVHTIVYRKTMDAKKYAFLAMIFIAFISGIMGMIMDSVPIVMALHKVISISVVYISAIHIFIHSRKLKMAKYARKNA